MLAGKGACKRHKQHIWRKARLIAHILKGVLVCAFVFPWLEQPGRVVRIRRWSQQLLAICGMQLEVRGNMQVPPPGTMVIANHISWIDIYAIHAWHPVRFVAKADIRGWPLVGWLCEKTGTLFIEREKRSDARRMMQEIGASLQQGDLVAVFPEGTTSDGSGLLHFHANLLQAPVNVHALILPIALRYEDAGTGQRSSAPAYIDDVTMPQCLDAILAAAPLRVCIQVGELLPAIHHSRRELSHLGRHAISEMLGLPEPCPMPADPAPAGMPPAPPSAGWDLPPA